MPGTTDCHRSGRGRLDLHFEVSEKAAISIFPGMRYCFARVMIRHLRNQLPGCMQPVCVEFADAEVTSATGKSIALDRGEHRFVAWNSPTGSVCRPRGDLGKIPVWRPSTGKIGAR